MDVRIRSWEDDDAAALSAAVTASLDELRPWMPWASAEPQAVEARRVWIASRARERDTFLAIEVDGAIAGGCGLHHRIAPDGLELGYWVATAFTGRGVATTAVRLLCAEAFADPAVTHVEIHHDVANTASGAVAARAGFAHITDHPRSRFSSADTDTAIWRLARAEWEG
jgi:ribosomal-protein-serine acetyltransferase